MAEICLTYLNSQQVRTLSASCAPDPQGARFLSYCSAYWGVHAKRGLSGDARSLALELLRGNYGQISTKLLLGRVPDLYLGRFDNCSPFNGLHCASFFGIVEVVATLIEIKYYDINEGDFMGCTPLTWASRNGHEEVVKMLVGRDEVNPDVADEGGRTPLSYAAEGGYGEVVRLLLEREEVNPDKPDNDGRTPLSYAAGGEHEGVVKLLLERDDTSPDEPDNDGRTPLSCAAGGGHEGVVKLLLERDDVNPDKSDNDGRTLLSYAAGGRTRGGGETTTRTGRSQSRRDR